MQIIVGCQRPSLSVFITATNCQVWQGTEINDETCHQTVCISSNLHVAPNCCCFLRLKIGWALTINPLLDGWISLSINLPIIFPNKQICLQNVEYNIQQLEVMRPNCLFNVTIQRYLISPHVTQTKASNPHINKAGNNCWPFLLGKTKPPIS